MKKATITQTKNNLSRLLDEVRQGNTVLIVDRQTPIALLEPYRPEASGTGEHLARLTRQGVIRAPRQKLAVASFLDEKGPALPKGASAAAAVAAEREESR